MKKIQLSIAYLAMFAMIFTSCSKDETVAKAEKATLSFSAILTDMATNRTSSKNHLADFPECSDDAPFFVEIVLMQGDNEVVGTSDDPYRVNLAPGQAFTIEDPMLELTPGNYILNHFAVYNESGTLIWVAPRNGGVLSGYVDTALPMNISLGAGVKKYVEVDVLCFDNREVNEYGYLFYELNPNVALEFCFFANLCVNQRHYTASYTVSIWRGTDASGQLLYNEVQNETRVDNNGDFAASPLCFALPDNDNMNEPYLYYRVTLQDWVGNYGDVQQQVITGTLTKKDIMDNFVGANNVSYEHLRFGCEDDGGTPPPGDSDGDGVPDATDNCPTVPGPASNNGCPIENCDPTVPNADCDNDNVLNKCDTDNANYVDFDCDGDTIINAEDDCPDEAGVPGLAGQNGCPTCVNDTPCDIGDVDSGCIVASIVGSNPEEDFVFFQSGGGAYGFGLYSQTDWNTTLGNIWTEQIDGKLVFKVDLIDSYALNGYVVEIRKGEGYLTPPDEECVEFACDNNPADTDKITKTFGPLEFSNGNYEGVWIRFKAYICPKE